MAPDDALDDALLRRYLLGLLPADETERLDELTVTSGEFTARLQAIEYDLVDAYTAGELSGEMLTAFKAGYPTFAAGRAEIDFAEALTAYHAQAATRAARARVAGPAAFAGPDDSRSAVLGSGVSQPRVDRPGPAPAAAFSRRGSWRARLMPRSMPRWTLAVAATLALVVTGYLVAENLSLRRHMDDVRAARAALDDRARGLQRQLDARRSADVETATELARLRASLAALEPRVGGDLSAPTVIASFVLPPVLRGTDVETIALPPKADAVRLQLPLEGERFSTFAVTLRDATSNQIVWHAAAIHPLAGHETHAVAITVPASLLKPRIYVIELKGLRTARAPEPLSPYAFQVVMP